MTLNQPLESLVCQIARMSRCECMAAMKSIERPRLDFTDEYLNAASLDQLRHILVAAVIQARKHIPPRKAG